MYDDYGSIRRPKTWRPPIVGSIIAIDAIRTGSVVPTNLPYRVAMAAENLYRLLSNADEYTIDKVEEDIMSKATRDELLMASWYMGGQDVHVL